VNKQAEKMITELLTPQIVPAETAMVKEGIVLLSHHNYWLRKASEEALEALKYDKLLKEAKPFEDLKSLQKSLEGRLALVALYKARAVSYKNKLHSLQSESKPQAKPQNGTVEAA